MRIASLMSDKKDDDLKPKIEKIVELTGASREDAAVALYDCDNDMPKAIEMILDGESLDSEWQSTGRKKRGKSTATSLSGPSQSTAADVSSAVASTTLTNGQQNNRMEKSNRSNKSNADGSGRQSLKGPGGRGGSMAGRNNSNRKKDYRGSQSTNNYPNQQSNDKDGADDGDVFNTAAVADRKSNGERSIGERGRRGGGRGGSRGLSRGRGGMARGSRTFMNRGMQNNQNSGGSGGHHHGSGSGGGGNQNGPNQISDGFPNSIDTWSNNAVESTSTTGSNVTGSVTGKPTTDDLQTMTVGNWSDVAANEDWTEEDWTQPMATKVFTPSTKVISEKDETNTINKSTMNEQQLQRGGMVYNNASGGMVVGKSQSNDQQQPPTMSSIIASTNNMQKQQPRQQQPQSQHQTSAGQAFIQHVSQNSNLNQYTYSSQFSKQATESIKSLVGMPSAAVGTTSSAADNAAAVAQSNAAAAARTLAAATAKVPANVQMSKMVQDTAVEMPSNDPIANLSVHFGSLEFGSSTGFPLGATDGSMFDTTTGGKKTIDTTKQSMSSLLPTAATDPNGSASNYRSSNSNQSANKMSGATGTAGQTLQTSQVLPHHQQHHHHSLNDSILNVAAGGASSVQQDHRTSMIVDNKSSATASLNANNNNTVGGGGGYNQKNVLERKSNDYMSQMSTYKSSNYNPNVGGNTIDQTNPYSSSTSVGGYHQQQSSMAHQYGGSVGVGGYNHHQVGFGANHHSGGSHMASQQQQTALMANAGGYVPYGNQSSSATTTGVVQQQQQNQKVLRDMDNVSGVGGGVNNTVQPVISSTNKYDSNAAVGSSSLGLMSSSTSTTNAIKNTLSSSKFKLKIKFFLTFFHLKNLVHLFKVKESIMCLQV